jgi:4-amino-4-deoxy-L-arabinose transferase-like glycosyltransferase
MATNGSPSPTSRVGPVLVLVLASVACLVPFADKAFHIDDPLFLWVAQQVREHPADFYGFKVDWDTALLPMSDVTKNPPLASYYIALVATVFGWGEVPLHLAFLVPAVGVIWGTHRLAQRLCSRPVLAALATLLTPAFLVSSTNVMCDTMMLCFWIWAVVLWERGLSGGRTGLLCASGCLIGLSILTKYFGISLVPLLGVYTYAATRTFDRRLLPLAIPIGFMIAYQALTYGLYGQNLIGEAVSYANQSQAKSSDVMPLSARLLVGLAFTGGCVACPVLFAPLLWSWRTLLGALVAMAVLVGVLRWCEWLGPFSLVPNGQPRWPLMAQEAFWAAGGVGLLVLAAADIRRHRDARSLLLFLWVMGTFVFTAVLNWTINARSILPAVPAAAILVMRRLDETVGPPGTVAGWRVVWPLVPGAALALAVTAADYQLADSERTAARCIAREFGGGPGRDWFEGHWGFQYYIQLQGWTCVSMWDVLVDPGDVVVIALNNYGLFQLPEGTSESMGRFEVSASSWVATMHPILGAGFYANSFGPLPFVFGPGMSEPYNLYRVTRPVRGRVFYKLERPDGKGRTR